MDRDYLPMLALQVDLAVQQHAPSEPEPAAVERVKLPRKPPWPRAYGDAMWKAPPR